VFIGTWDGWAHNVHYFGFGHRGDITRNATAVTGACMMIRPSVFWRLGGNDERLRVAYNDVDLCLRAQQAGYRVVYTPHVELFHFEGASRGRYEHPDDGPWFEVRWRPRETMDPYYNPMLSRLVRFSLKR
jgi:GT2 family glycosyltransferase